MGTLFLANITGKIEFVSYLILMKERTLQATGIPLVFFLVSLIFSMLYFFINTILLEKVAVSLQNIH